MTATNQPPLTKKDFKSDQDVRWCPGCGDYAILNAVQSAFAKIGRPRHQVAVISGIGCSSRFPYYMETYGFHTIHGRAPTLATGLKLARPELDVWVVTGDGDGLSIGGNHLMHVLRRNVGVKILLFNNRIYGLTKGQYSPTSEQGKITKSTPMGSIDYPFHPVSVALGAEATFVARSVDVFLPHLEQMVQRAAAHEGTALLEIYQNCNIFNDGAFKTFTDKDVREARVLQLEHGKPLLFDGGHKGLRVGAGHQLEVVELDGRTPEQAGVLSWDEASADPSLAMALAHLPEATMPVPIGVLRCRARTPFEKAAHAQIEAARKKRGDQPLDDVLRGPETWVVS